MDALKNVLRMTGAAALTGVAARGGLEVLRQTDNNYKPPQAPDPIIIDIPRPVPAAVPMLPPPHKMKEIPATPSLVKAADLEKTFESLPFGRQIYKRLPTLGGATGGPNAQTGDDVPLQGLGMGVGIPLGAGAGYMLTDRLLRAADRRRANKDLEEAQQEYQVQALNKIRSTHFPAKVAAAIVDGEPTNDPTIQRIKKALDKAYTLSKRAETVGKVNAATQPNAWAHGLAAPSLVSPVPTTAPTSGFAAPAPFRSAPPAPPALSGGQAIQSTPTLASSTPIPSIQSRTDGKLLPPEKAAADEWGKRLMSSWLWPGIPAGEATGEPSLGRANMALAGTLGLAGGYMGWRAARDNDDAKMKADYVRKMIKKKDEANSSSIATPLIARMVPVPQ
jgi:hypothetical protein